MQRVLALLLLVLVVLRGLQVPANMRLPCMGHGVDLSVLMRGRVLQGVLVLLLLVGLCRPLLLLRPASTQVAWRSSAGWGVSGTFAVVVLASTASAVV